MSFRDAAIYEESSSSVQQKEFRPLRDLIDNIRDNVRSNRERRKQARFDRESAATQLQYVHKDETQSRTAYVNSYDQHRRHNESSSTAHVNQYDQLRRSEPFSRTAFVNQYDQQSHKISRHVSADSTQERRIDYASYKPHRPGNTAGDVAASTVEPPLADPPANRPEERPQDNQTAQSEWEKIGFPDRMPYADEVSPPPETISIKERNGQTMVLAEIPNATADDRLGAYLQERGRELVELDLNGTGISEKGLGLLSKAANLVKLGLNDTEANDDSLAVLAKQGLRNLQDLNLHSTRVGDAGVAQLRGIPLKTLNLSDTIVSDDCLQQLKTMRTLQVLTFDYSGIGNDGVKAIKEMPNLRSLSLKGCPITDDCVADLAKCQQLMLLNLEDTKLSADKLAWLQKHMPRCVIVAPEGTAKAAEGHHNNRRGGSKLFKLPMFSPRPRG